MDGKQDQDYLPDNILEEQLLFQSVMYLPLDKLEIAESDSLTERGIRDLGEATEIPQFFAEGKKEDE